MALMPWEPAPALTTTPPNPSTTIPTRGGPQQATASTSSSTPASNGEVNIKQEPGVGYEKLAHAQASAIPSGYGNQAAMQRATQQIQEKYGQAANSTVNQLQARAELATPVGQTQNRPQNAPPPNPSQMTEEQRRLYSKQLEARTKSQQQQNMAQYYQAQRASVGNSQTDGAGDWQAMVAERRAAAALGGGSHEADLTIRQQVEQMSHEMEGGGLMLPLAEHKKRSAQKKGNRDQKTSTQTTLGELVAAQTAATTPNVPPQFDGGPDSEDESGQRDEVDEDAINSDLDDPDDDIIEDTEEDANTGDLILCTYDKVQRVKNKWYRLFICFTTSLVLMQYFTF